MPPKPPHLDERQAELIRTYVQGEDVSSLPPSRLPPPPRAPAPKNSDPVAHVVEGTHKRMVWIVGICALLGGAVMFGWHAKDAIDTVTSKYYPAAAGSTLASNAEEDRKHLVRLEERMAAAEKINGEQEKAIADQASRFDHAVKPGNRKLLIPPLPAKDAGSEAGPSP